MPKQSGTAKPSSLGEVSRFVFLQYSGAVFAVQTARALQYSGAAFAARAARV